VTKKAYFPAIDGLRLLASLNIVFLHLASSSALLYASSWKWVMPIVKAPAFSASLFFILAGFLFASKFSDPERRLPVIPFMFGRIAKLYRLHFICTVLMFCILIFKFSGIHAMPTSWDAFFACISTGLANMAHPWRSLLMHLSLTWSFAPELGMKLNEPSWALSAFFVCYAITPWCARKLSAVTSPKALWLLFGAVFVPGIIWGLIFSVADWGVFPILGDFSNYEVRYRFFHMFPFVRIFEYLFGMVLFRLYKERQFRFFEKDYWSGIAQIFLLCCLYASLFMIDSSSISWNFIGHHSLPVLLFGLLIISLTTSKGWLAILFCIRPVRAVGRASFYPYLIHLPLISIAWMLGDLNSPQGTLLFLIFIYSISTFYQQYKDHRRKKAKARVIPLPT